MGCKTVHFDGGSAMVCSRGRRTVCATPMCGRASLSLCDYPVERNGKKTTCDRHMCAIHRHPVPGEFDRDWCEWHWGHEQRQQQRGGYAGVQQE